jgi:hypothetical protein
MSMRGTTSDDLDILTREELIEWLCWNDRNGCYRDDETIAEFGEILPYEEAYWIAKRQINQ